MRVRRSTLIGAAAVVVLAAGSTAAVAAAGGTFTGGTPRSSASCAAPVLAGTVVDVSLFDMGQMMGGPSSDSTMGTAGFLGPMGLITAPASASTGVVSFRVHNSGSRTHELVVLPLAAGRVAGRRMVGQDARVSETGSLGEASRTCGAGAGSGIRAGTTGWVTLTLGPGAYELVCNLPHHYRDGMDATFVVS